MCCMSIGAVVDDSEDPRAIRAKEAQAAVATAVRVPDLPVGWSAFKHKESGMPARADSIGGLLGVWECACRCD